MTAKNAHEQTNDAKKLKIVHDQERWMEEMNRSFKILREKKFHQKFAERKLVVKLGACGDSTIAY